MRAALTTATVAAVAIASLHGQTIPPVFQFALVDRTGEITRLGPTLPGTFSMRISPDGSRIVMDSADGIYIADVRDVTSRRQLVPAPSAYPIWSDDGRQVLYIGISDGQESLFAKRVESAEPPELIVKGARAPESWTRNGMFTFIRLTGPSDYAVWGYMLRSKAPQVLVDSTGSAQHSSQFSPDAGLLAFASNESGRFEVYVQGFPEPAVAVRVTSGGGAHPLWSRDAKSLYFDRDGKLFEVSVQVGNPIKAGTPRELPIAGFIQGVARRQFDLMPDGRFLMLLP